MYEKAQYLLKRFSNREWSGPAWYRCILNKNGFPIHWHLLYFEALDLGHGAATEYEGEDLSKAVFKIYKEYEKLLKGTYLGMIHSHHNMGAYHSGTDEETLIDLCPETGFYGSLVVSSKVSQAAAFAFSYKDQFKNILIHALEDEDIRYAKPEANKAFVAEGDRIAEKSKVTPYQGNYKGYTAKYDPNQGVLDWKTKYQPRTQTNGYSDISYNDQWQDEPKVSVADYHRMESIMEQLDTGKMLYSEASNLFQTQWGMHIHEFLELDMPVGA
tara:strand:- start:985 stop:1797 length:813 start_codon:yes stop_codon:yes gene_type:complete